MKVNHWAAALIVTAGAWQAAGQTAVDLSRQGKVGTGTTLPVHCTVGQIFFKTDAPVGTNLFSCAAADSWTAVGLPALSGDVSGTQQSVTVRRLQGRGVSATAPADQNVLRWNATSSQWEPSSPQAPAWTTVSFSATPTFAITNPIQGFQITLTGNVTSASFSGTLPAGQIAMFKVCENATGGYTFTPPASVVGFGVLDTTASVCNTQVFQYDGTKMNAITTMRTDNAAPRVSAVNGLYPLPASPTTLVGTTDSRLSDARTPAAHASSHKNGGPDEIATATPGANAIPKAGSNGRLPIGWVASGTPDGTKYVRDDGILATPPGGGGGNGSSEKSVAQCGVVGDNVTDDTAALNACIANLPDYGTLFVPLNFRIKVTDKVLIHNKYGFHIKGETSGFGGPSMGTQVPAILWYGVDGGTVLDIKNSQNGIIEHLAIFSSSNYGNTNTGAGVLIDVDQVAPNYPVTTNLTFDYLALVGNQRRTPFNAIQFAMTSQNNVEHMTVSNTYIACSDTGALGTGILLGPSYNAIAHLYQHNSISNCEYGILESLGSGNVVDNQFNLNKVHMVLNPILPVQVVRNDSENCNYNQPAGTHEGGFLLASGYLTVAGNRIANCHLGGGVAAIRFGSGNVKFSSNVFDQGDEPGISGTPAMYVFSENNAYPTNGGNSATSVAGFRTFSGFTSHWDAYGDGNNPFTAISTYSGSFLDGMGKLLFDKESEKWQVQERGLSGTNDIKQTLVPFLHDGEPGCGTNGPARLGAFLFNPAVDTTTFKFCGKKGGTYTWLQPVVPIKLDRDIPAAIDTNNVTDLGTFQFSSNWGATFDISIQGVGNGGTDFALKSYRFTVGYPQSGMGWFRVNPMSQVGPAVSLDYDLEALVAGVAVSLRLRKTASTTTGTWHATLLSWGTSGFTESAAVNTDTNLPAQFLGDTVLSQSGGVAVFYGDLKLKSGVHVTTAAAGSDTAGLITINTGATSKSLTFAKAFAAAPVCVLTPTSDQLATIASFWVTTSTTAVTANVHTTPASSVTFAYHCFGNPN